MATYEPREGVVLLPYWLRLVDLCSLPANAIFRLLFLTDVFVTFCISV